MSDVSMMPSADETNAPLWWQPFVNLDPTLLLVAAAPVAIAAGLLAPELGPYMLVGFLGIAGGVVSVLRPGIGLFLFTVMMYTRASEVLTTSLGVPSIAPLFTIWLLTGVIMHFGIGGLFHARPTGWQGLVVYGLVLLASTLVAANPWAASYRVVDYVRELVYIALIIMCVRQLSDLRIVVRAIIVGATVPALLTIYQILTGSTNAFLGFGKYSEAIVVPGEITEVARPAGMVGDPNFYALALIAVIPLAFHRARWEKSHVARQLSLLSGLLLALASVMTYSRGGFVTLAVVIACLAVTGFIRYQTLLAVGIVVALMLPVMPTSYSGRVTSLFDIPRNLLSNEPPERGAARDTSVSGRVSEVMSGVHMFLDHPILGVGGNNYPVHYQEYARPMGVDRRADRAPHSLYIEIAAETGILGIAAFGALVVTIFAALRRVWQTTNRGNELHDLALMVAVSLLAILVGSIFLHMAYPRYLMVFAGLALATASVQNWRTAPGSRLRFSRLRPTQALLNPIQHGRMVVWGGAAGIAVLVLVSALLVSISIDPSGRGLFTGETQAAIRPMPGMAGMPSSTPRASDQERGSAGSTATGGASTPTSMPTTPTPQPTAMLDLQTQAELLAPAAQPATPRANCTFIDETQHNICGAFSTYYAVNGGEATFGRPLSEEYIVGGISVQYFELARMEWHTDNGDEFILLSRLGAERRFRETGREVDPPDIPVTDEDCFFEDITGHNICSEFAFHWVSNGGIRIFGLPVTEQFVLGGNDVQYFERARLEMRPNADGSFDVIVSALGSEDVARILNGTGGRD